MPLNKTDPSLFTATRPVHWFESLHIRLSLGLLIIVGILIIAVYAVNQTLLRNVLIENKFDLVEQAGNSLVTELGQQIEATESLTRSIASVGRDLPPDESLYKIVIPHMMENESVSPIVAGGGVWPEPYKFDKNIARRSFFWARKDTSELLYYDDYNATEGHGYHNEEWYVPAKYIGQDKCFWSKSYMDPFSFEPMVTCSVPMQDRDEISGVATIDLKLSGLQKFFSERAEKLGGYAFAVDRNNKFLSYPKMDLVQGKKDNGQPGDLITVKNFTELQPGFQPLATQLSDLSQTIMDSAQALPHFNPDLAARLAQESYQINEEEAQMIVATFSDPLQTENSLIETSHRFALKEDIVLNEPVLVSMFVMPKVYWKIVVVTPQRIAYKDANAVTEKIMFLLIGILLISMIGAYFWLKRILVQPLLTMTNEIKGSPLKKITLSKSENDSFTEIDLLASTINSMRDQISRSFDELQQSENRFRLIAETLPEGLAITRLSDGVILYLNGRLKQMLSIPDEGSSYESKLIDFFEDPQDRIRLFKQLKKSNEVNDFVAKAQRLDGSKFWATISTSSVTYAGQPALVSGILDISNRKEAEEEVARYRDHLEQMVQERTAELEETKTLAVNAAAAKQNFLANMSHEIRTPLNSVVGISHLLLLKEFMPAQKRYLLNLHKSGKILLKIINDILDITKMDAGKLEPEHVLFDLNDVFDDISIHIRPLLTDKIIGVYINRPQNFQNMLIGDPFRLEQVLLNLISNAIKFTHEGHVKLSVDFHHDGDQNLCLKIKIEDTGIGMTEEQSKTVFNAFSQADTGITREYGGTGLGLTISQNLLALMNGHLDVKSHMGEGSVFTIVLPIEKSLQKIQNPFINIEDMYQCLIISNDLEEVKVINSLLTNWSFPSEHLTFQDDISSAVKSGKFRFLIMDWDHAPARRNALLKEISGLSEISNLSILAITQSITETDESLLEKGTIDAIISKPLRASRLKNTLGYLLGLPIKDTDLLYGDMDMHQSRQVLTGLNILLVEDNEQNQFVADEILSGAGANIIIATNGKDALHKVESHGVDNFDLILMDLHMPVMDGFVATVELKKLYGAQTPPIIALSAEIFDEVISKCKDFGMDDYLSKPFSPSDMVSTILRWIKGLSLDKEFTKAPQKTTISAYERLSTEKGLANFDGKEDLYKNLLSQYVEKYQNFENQICQHLHLGEDEEASRYIHTFTGLSATIGATEVERLARSYKKSLKNSEHTQENEKNLRILLEELDGAFTEIKLFLESDA